MGGSRSRAGIHRPRVEAGGKRGGGAPWQMLRLLHPHRLPPPWPEARGSQPQPGRGGEAPIGEEREGPRGWGGGRPLRLSLGLPRPGGQLRVAPALPVRHPMPRHCQAHAGERHPRQGGARGKAFFAARSAASFSAFAAKSSAEVSFASRSCSTLGALAFLAAGVGFLAGTLGEAFAEPSFGEAGCFYGGGWARVRALAEELAGELAVALAVELAGEGGQGPL